MGRSREEVHACRSDFWASSLVCQENSFRISLIKSVNQSQLPLEFGARGCDVWCYKTDERIAGSECKHIYICKNEDVGFADPISDYRHASTSKVVTRRSSHFFPFQLQAFMTTSAIWTRWPLRSICLCELRLSVPLERLGAALAAAAPSVLRAVVRGSCGACTSSTFARLRPPAPDFDPYLNFKLKMYLGQTIQQFMAKEVLNLRCAL